MSYKILVTGGARFTGSHLVDELIDKGNEVTILDNLESQLYKAIQEYLNEKAELVKEDVRNKEKLKEVMEDIEIMLEQGALYRFSISPML